MVKILVMAVLILLSLSIAVSSIEAEVLVNKSSHYNDIVSQSSETITLFPPIKIPLKETPLKESKDVEGWIEPFKSSELSSVYQPFIAMKKFFKDLKEVDEYIKGQAFCKMKVMDNYKEEFLKAAKVEYYDGVPIYGVLIHYVEGEDGKYYEEINGKIVAIIEPLPVTVVKIPISGSVSLGWAYWRGPFEPSVFQIAVYLQYTPTDHIVLIGLRNYDTGELINVQMLTGGSGWVVFSNLNQNIRYAIGIINPRDGNTQTITYSGAIYIYYV
ncbi:MAG: hypothetical protein QXX13_07660 [Candidatus Methanomethylicia archaeon]